METIEKKIMTNFLYFSLTLMVVRNEKIKSKKIQDHE